MNQLDPELRRLIHWAREAGPAAATEPPFGFVTRVLAARRAALADAEPPWAHRLRWGVASLSLLVLASGLVFWSGERREANNAYNFVPTFQLAVHNLAP